MSSRRQRTVATAVLAIALVGAGGAVATGARSGDGGNDNGQPAAASSPAASPTQDTTGTQPLQRSVPVQVQVRRMRLEAPVVRLEAGQGQVMELPPLRRAGWDSTSVTPGEKGVSVLAGFIRRDDQPGVFKDLGRLRRGDPVVVRREDSSTVRFEVDRIVSYELGTFPADQVYASNGLPELRLISTGGSLQGQPPGNVVVYATAVPPTGGGE